MPEAKYAFSTAVEKLSENESKQDCNETHSYYQYYRPYQTFVKEASELSNPLGNGSSAEGKAAWHKTLLKPFNKRR